MTIARDIEELRAELYSLTCSISELEDEWRNIAKSSSEHDFYRNHLRRLRDDKARVESAIVAARRQLLESGDVSNSLEK